jgi:hypothetical protein
MYLAAIGDINGNLSALRAVLNAIDDAGIQIIFNTGNSAVGKSSANECISMLRARGAISVQGETDRRLVHFLRKRETLKRKLDPAQFQCIEEAHANITSENLEYLRGLPRSRVVSYESVSYTLFHGTPTSQADYLNEDDTEDRFRRIREAANTEIMVFNGGAQGFWRLIDECLFAGTAAVDASEPSYTLIDTETHPPRAEILRIKC